MQSLLNEQYIPKEKEPPTSAVPFFEDLLLVVGAAHALVALAGMAVAVRAHIDGFELADILRAVMAAGGDGTMNSLVHDHFLHVQIDLEQSLGVIVSGARRIIPAYIFSALQ